MAGPRPLQQAPFIVRVLEEQPAKFGRFLADPAKYRFQVLLTEVVDEPTGPRLIRHGYRCGAEYFYPASTIKLCAAVVALKRLGELQRATGQPLSLTTPLAIHPIAVTVDQRRLPAPPERTDDSNFAGGAITLAHEIRKLFLVSDNPAYNRLLDFVGHAALHETLWAAGLTSVRLSHRLSESRPVAEHRVAAAVDLGPVDSRSGGVGLPPRVTHVPPWSAVPVPVGRGQLPPGGMAPGDVSWTPMDFAAKNAISLRDLQDLLILVCRPDAMPSESVAALGLSESHRAFLIEAMTELPGRSANPVYDPAEFPDDYGKFFLPGLIRAVGAPVPPSPSPGGSPGGSPPPKAGGAPKTGAATPGVSLAVLRAQSAVRVANKLGRAYGFSIDNARVLHAETGRTFFLAATVYTNENGVLNDDEYEYESLADPLMADLAEALAAALWAKPGPESTPEATHEATHEMTHEMSHEMTPEMSHEATHEATHATAAPAFTYAPVASLSPPPAGDDAARLGMPRLGTAPPSPARPAPLDALPVTPAKPGGRWLSAQGVGGLLGALARIAWPLAGAAVAVRALRGR